MCLSENDTHPIVESDTVDATVDATVSKRSVDHNCVPKPFDPDSACGASVCDVLVPQQFQDCITTAPPTTHAISAQKSHNEGMPRSGVMVSRRQPSKLGPSRRLIGLGWSFGEWNKTAMSNRSENRSRGAQCVGFSSLREVQDWFTQQYDGR